MATRKVQAAVDMKIKRAERGLRLLMNRLKMRYQQSLFQNRAASVLPCANRDCYVTRIMRGRQTSAEKIAIPQKFSPTPPEPARYRDFQDEIRFQNELPRSFSSVILSILQAN